MVDSRGNIYGEREQIYSGAHQTTRGRKKKKMREFRGIQKIMERSIGINWTLHFLETKAEGLTEFEITECIRFLVEEIDRRRELAKRRYYEAGKTENKTNW